MVSQFYWGPIGRTLDLQLLHQIMKDYWFFDLRNMYERIEVEAAGFRYEGVGR